MNGQTRPVPPVRCTFYLRAPVDPRDPGAGARYEVLPILSPGAVTVGLPIVSTEYPPEIGDRVGGVSGMYRVVDREWIYPERGSKHWPINEPRPVVGPSLMLIVERAPGMFADQVLHPEDTDENVAAGEDR